VALCGPFRTVERRAVPSGANLAAWAENSWKRKRFSPFVTAAIYYCNEHLFALHYTNRCS